MLKRDLPNTPIVSRSPLITQDRKRFRDYASPITTKDKGRGKPVVTNNSTPLRKQTSYDDVQESNINDDQQEKREKRAVILQRKKTVKATLLSPAAHASPKASAPTKLTLTPRSAAIHSAINRPLSTSEPPNIPIENISVAQMSKNFEDWIKAAADNRINSKNSWSVALIDYFQDLTFLKDDKPGGGINFQKASCTLDGCVKIYSSRVDSVVEATTKLLNGLGTNDGMNNDHLYFRYTR